LKLRQLGVLSPKPGAQKFALVAGQATNVNFVVTRTNWPRLQAPVHVSSNQFQFLLSGLAGQTYSIFASTNLSGSNWTMILATNAPCSTVLVVDPAATNNQHVYRAQQVP
jgi:hypothetical protein